eukprot:TRINITY_DN10006_c0_g1_i2.p1 TRINITY_DN10006_c0_g1~~TRINITY_DN10006_c0_g1_i2.p1  ORF type:complete len:1401 (-),score=439.04 TRINITY_DN10006_c0_g1_i2:19-4221(-)
MDPKEPPNPSQVVYSRSGLVMVKNSILKADHFRSTSPTTGKNTLSFEGAPNFREAAEYPVYGVGQCTFSGIQAALRHILHTRNNNDSSPTRLVLAQVREEPVIYIAGCPFVLRESGYPFSNLLLKQINAERLERLETRLKNDVIAEAKAFQGNVLVHDEGEEGKLVPRWIHVDHESDNPDISIMTPREIIEHAITKIKAASSPSMLTVDYHRVPVAQSGLFPQAEIDALLRVVTSSFESSSSTASASTPTTPPMMPVFLFNSQTGLTRASMAMTVACQVYRHIAPHAGQSASDLMSSHKPLAVPAVIHSLARLVRHGRLARATVDHLLDICWASTQQDHNIRRVLALGVTKYSSLTDPKYLSSVSWYMALIALEEFLDRPSVEADFSLWLSKRPGVLGLVHQMERHPDRALVPHELALHDMHHSHLLSPARGVSPFSPASPFCSAPMRQAAESVITERNGTLLNFQAILKVDFMPSHHDATQLDPARHAGVDAAEAPNFRSLVEGDKPIYGVAQPTMSGIRSIVRHVSGGRPRHIVWVHLREEPLVFVGNTPYVVRNKAQPFKPWVGAHIDEGHLDELEVRLAADVKDELTKYDGAVLVHVERSGRVKPRWLTEDRPHPYDGANSTNVSSFMKRMQQREDASSTPVDNNNANANDTNRDATDPFDFAVRTPGEVFAKVAAETGHTIQYVRVPVPYCGTAEVADFDTILRHTTDAPSDAVYVFSCQNGIGRTSMGMVIGCMITYMMAHRDKQEAIPARPPNDGLSVLSPKLGALQASPEQVRFLEGDYQVILNVVRVMERGVHARVWTDYFIDECSLLKNLRVAIFEYKRQYELAKPDDKIARKQAKASFVHYLERYFVLIVFQAYLMDTTDTTSTKTKKVTFAHWVEERPEIVQLLDYLHNNPKEDIVLTSGTPRLPALPSPSASTPAPPSLSLSADAVLVVDDAKVVASRWGMVLGKHSILKSDHFPGCHNKALTPHIEGAPNFRHVGNNPVYGVGQSTVPGIMGVLKQMGAAPLDTETQQNCLQRLVVWTNLREEPVLYVGGAPYVLRESRRPFKNLVITSIDTERLERVEARLKNDVLMELEQFGGRLLLHDETAAGLTPLWVEVKSPHDEDGMGVHTPREIYDILARKGYNVDYARVPITDEQAPEEKDFDTIVTRLRDHVVEGAEEPQYPLLIFNCQMGRGRTTTGMSIGYLACSLIPGLAESPTALLEDIATKAPSPPSQDPDEDLLHGDYQLILRLVQLLDGGAITKAVTDRAVDMCGNFQNLRTCILKAKQAAIPAPPPAPFALASSASSIPLPTTSTPAVALLTSKAHEVNEHLLHVAYDYLVRYFHLIAFCQYLLDECARLVAQDDDDDKASSSSPSPSEDHTFVQWMKSRSEIQTLLTNSRKNMQKALR